MKQYTIVNLIFLKILIINRTSYLKESWFKIVLNEPTYPINCLIKKKNVLIPYTHERNSLGLLIKKSDLSSNREITNK